jgi:hypothetical protein
MASQNNIYPGSNKNSENLVSDIWKQNDYRLVEKENIILI